MEIPHTQSCLLRFFCRTFCTFACLASGSVFAQVANRVPVAETDPYRMLYALVIVLAAIAGVAWLLKKMQQGKVGGGYSAVRVVGGVNVGTRERVMVVEVAGRWIVLGVAPGQVTALAEMAQPDDAGVYVPSQELPETSSPSVSFMSIIKKTLGKSSN